VTTATAVRRPSLPTRSTQSPFAALRSRSYRIYLSGQLLASVGTWMQSIALDWLVLSLTHSSTAVGVTMALQFVPMLLFGVHGGLIADRFPKRRILLVTQTAGTGLAGTLAVLTITGAVRVELVYAFALIGGVVFVVDAPTRQAFVTEVVRSDLLRPAVALNAAMFQTTRLIGPALASLLIGTVGTGWAFAANAGCAVGPTIGLLLLRARDLTPTPMPQREPRALRTALTYVAAHRHLLATILLVGVVGTFGLNYPIVLTAMASRTFHGGAGTYGLFNTALAIGSVGGALLAGSRRHTRLRLIVLAGAAFGLLQAVAASAPTIRVFFVLLVVLGIASLGFQSMANSSVQLWVDPPLRGRVMGLYMLVFIGGTTIGAPVVGALTNHFGARFGMAFCGLVSALAALIIAVMIRRTAATTQA
jgi:MFS family permease